MKQVCCCSLATACIVIGILGIIYSFSEVVFPVRTIAAGKETSPYRVWLCQELNLYLYLYLYICIMTIYAKNIKYHMEYYVTGPFFLVTAAIFTVILLQNKRRSLHFSISCPLPSNSVPPQISRCSWFSSTPNVPFIICGCWWLRFRIVKTRNLVYS